MTTATTERYVSPRVNVVEDAEGVTIQADFPGVSKEAAEVEVHEGRLILRGKREANGDAGSYRVRERLGGGYYRAFEVGDTLDPTKVEANLEDGVLTVTVPKSERAKPRTITVN